MAKDVEKDWREEASERYKEKISKGRFKLTEGDNTIRILPRVKAKSKVPFYEYLVHREVGPHKRFMRCGKNLHGEGECWLCDQKIPALSKSESESKQKMAAALQPKEQFVVQVAIVDSDSGKMKGPFLWTVPTGGARSLAARLLGVLKNTKRDYIHPTKGYNLTIERTGTGKTDTNYGQPIADEEPSKVPEELLNRAKPFSELIPAYSEEQMKAAYFGQDAEGETEKPRRSEEDEDDRPKKKKPRDDEEEETEEEETEEGEEDEDEKPKKKKKPADEEEEEESTEEEEEEEAPKKKKKHHEEEEEEEESTEEEEEEERPKKKKKHVEDEEEEVTEEDEEEVTETEEEEEEEKPKKKKKHVDEEEEEEEERPAKKKKKHEEEEEEESETEEDEDEEKPKKKVKKHSEEDEEEEERPKKKKKHRSDDDE